MHNNEETSINKSLWVLWNDLSYSEIKTKIDD